MTAKALLVASLLTWAFTGSEAKIELKSLEDGVALSCSTNGTYTYESGETETAAHLKLDYDDGKSGTFDCDSEKMFVKFRTCDNCMELDYAVLAMVAVGNVSAVVMICWAVYNLVLQLASRSSSSSSSSSAKKDSGRQPLLPSDHDGHYQPLKPRAADEYSRLPNRH